MRGLQRFEQKLEQAVSGAFARAFRSAVQPVEITAALQRELDNKATIMSRERRLVPNTFHVELYQGDLDRFEGYHAEMVREITESLEEHARSQGYVFPGPISIDFEAADDLTTGRFRVLSSATASVVSNATNTQYGRARAFLVVNRTQHPLNPPGLVVGRGTEADVRINDPGVSRRHAEFQVEIDDGRPAISVRDLGSTNGIIVDGHKVSAVPLHHGSVVRAGSTDMSIRIVEDGDV